MPDSFSQIKPRTSDSVSTKNTPLNELKLRNLLHQNSDKEYPFYPLSPSFEETSTGEWWLRYLKRLAQDVGRQNLARNLFCLENIGYHSTKCSGTKGRKTGEHRSTQLYTRHLLLAAMDDKKEIIFMRSRKQWESLVPELRDYPQLHILKNPQRVYITPGNLDSYDRLLSTLSD